MSDMNMQHGDEAQDQAQLEPIITVIKQILDKMTAMDEELDSLSKLVNEEIIGGITNLYNSKQRMSGISSLSEKYGEKVSPYKDFYGELSGGSDIFEALYNDLDEMKSQTADWSDEKEAARVEQLADELKSRLERMSSIGSKVLGGSTGSTEGEPDSSVEIAVEAPKEEKGSSDLVDKIKRMKSKAGDVRF
jgi:hypothetical protein